MDLQRSRRVAVTIEFICQGTGAAGEKNSTS
jgi:hypothetical protein